MAFDEVSSPVLAKKFSSPDFKPDEYVKALVAKCDIYRSLIDHKNNIQKLGDETAVSLKKNVYRNYRQFIDTSKEISYLEAEMYQLSHLLTEQKSLLADQLQMSIFERPKGLPTLKDPTKEAEKLKKKNFLENMDAAQHIVGELATKDLLFEGELTEFDVESYSPIHKINAFLLNDSFLIATLPTGGGKYRFQTMLDLSDIAVVNVRDGGGIKNAFKMLYALDSRMFCAPSKEAKTGWMTGIEEAKRNYRTGVQKDAQKFAEFRLSQDLDSSEEDEIEEEPGKEDAATGTQEVQYPNLLNVDWLIELPEDVDMCLAQRDFDGGVRLIEKGLAYLRDFPESTSLSAIRNKIDLRVNSLCVILEKSLDNSQSSRHVSLRSIRGYVQLLIRLGRPKLARELFLRNRAFEIKNSFKQLKMEGATTLFITKLANVFFTALIETGKEYRKIFPKNAHCSAFVVWGHSQLKVFVDRFSRQVFTRSAELSSVASCVKIAIQDCGRLEMIGMDMSFDLHHMLLKGTLGVMFDCRDQLLERGKHGAMEDDWIPVNYASQPEKMTSLLSDMSSFGVKVDDFVEGDTITLSECTVEFARSVLDFLHNGLKLYTSESHTSFVQCVCDLFKAQVFQFDALLKMEDYKSKIDFIMRNVDFVSKRVFSLTQSKLEERVGHEITSVQEVADELDNLRPIAALMKAK